MYPIYHYDIEQRSEAWFALKELKMSASHATAIANCGKGLDTYINEIVRAACEKNHESYFNNDMQRGNDLEDIAATCYELETGLQTKQIGFITYNEYVGCSPDRLVGDNGGLEIKARANKEHFRLLTTNKPDSEVIWQIQMCLLISQRKWWDFVSYNPNFKKSLFIQRIYPDQLAFVKLKNGFMQGEELLLDLLNKPAIKYELQK
jgi:hypothetical protein